MGNKLLREQIAPGAYFSSVRDGKFKNNRITAHMILPLRRENATQNALLPFLMRKGSADCPDFTALNRRLTGLYGATLEADVGKFRNSQVMELSIIGLDDRFALEREEVVRQCAQLLAGVLFRPHFVEGSFPAADVELEKNYLKNTIEGEINDKRSYAMLRALDTMNEGQPNALRKYGYIEDLDRITPAACREAYDRMIAGAQFEIFFTGSGDPAPAKEIFAEALASLVRRPVEIPAYEPQLTAGTVKEVTEEMVLSQSKLVLGFRLGRLETQAQQNAMRMMAAIFGGTPFSKLFLNVREKHSLCYYCAARYDRALSLMLVDSGLSAENKDQAVQEILRQLEEMKAGRFTDEELESTKMALATGLRSTTDSLGAMETWYMNQILRGCAVSPEEDWQALRRVTAEEIVEAAAGVTLDTVYLLKGKEA